MIINQRAGGWENIRTTRRKKNRTHNEEKGGCHGRKYMSTMPQKRPLPFPRTTPKHWFHRKEHVCWRPSYPVSLLFFPFYPGFFLVHPFFVLLCSFWSNSSPIPPFSHQFECVSFCMFLVWMKGVNEWNLFLIGLRKVFFKGGFLLIIWLFFQFGIFKG